MLSGDEVTWMPAGVRKGGKVDRQTVSSYLPTRGVKRGHSGTRLRCVCVIEGPDTANRKIHRWRGTKLT